MCRIIFLLILASQLHAQYNLSICSIFKNEAPYFREWIEFHKLQGVEHFYLYNNNSTDNYLEVLNPYVEAGIVTLIDWPHSYPSGAKDVWLGIQRKAYMHCVRKCKNDTRWLAVIDSDEFLFCPGGETLPIFLAAYTEYGGICVNSLHFGTSNVESIPEGFLMIELLTRCSVWNHNKSYVVKSIVQPKYVAACPNTPHDFTYVSGRHAVNARREIVDFWQSDDIILDKIRINHYWTRTEQHFREKKAPSRHKRRSGENYETLSSQANSFNQSEDTAILQFVPALREKMRFELPKEIPAENAPIRKARRLF